MYLGLWGGGRQWHVTASLFLEKSPNDFCFSGRTALRLVNKSPCCFAQMFFRKLFLGCISERLFVVLSL